jgi:prophage antirepressor-like protein
MNELIPFFWGAAHVRVLLVDGEPWFVAGDVCRELGYQRSRDAISQHCKGAVKRRLPTAGGEQDVTLIPERDIYRLVMRSKLPGAVQFEEWVVGEVLPAIRKTGGYAMHAGDPLAALNDPAKLRTLLLGYSEKVLALEARVEAQAPKVAALERIATGTAGSMSVREAAKTLQAQPKALTEWMVTRRWIYRHPLGRTWLAYQPRLLSGMLEHKLVSGKRADDTDWGSTQVRVTARGLARIAELLEQETQRKDCPLFAMKSRDATLASSVC